LHAYCLKMGWRQWLLVTTLTLLSATVFADRVGQAIQTQVGIQKEAAKVQRRIDQLDDQTRGMIETYRARLAELEELQDYTGQLEKMLADQADELAQRERQLKSLETLNRKLFPFLLEMLESLDRIVQVDTPFLRQERRERVKSLRTLMNRADVALPEKYRRLMEAFRIEARYGHNIETYEAPLETQGKSRTVRFLRFGRVGLYYLTLDGQEGGVWAPDDKRWRALDRDFLRPLDHAMRIAAKQAPPDLITLPVPAPEGS